MWQVLPAAARIQVSAGLLPGPAPDAATPYPGTMPCSVLARHSRSCRTLFASGRSRLQG